MLQMLCLMAAHMAEPSTHHPTKCCWRGRPTAPPGPSTPLPFWSGWGGSLQELGRTLEAGKPGCSRHGPALRVGSGQGGPSRAQVAPRGAVQLPPAVWKHVLCPALTRRRLESRRVTELANSTVWKRRVGAHCRQDAGRTPSDCSAGAHEGFRKGRSLPERGCHRDEDSSGSSWAGGTASHSQEGTGGRRGSRQCQDGTKHQHLTSLCPCLPRLNFPW